MLKKIPMQRIHLPLVSHPLCHHEFLSEGIVMQGTFKVKDTRFGLIT